MIRLLALTLYFTSAAAQILGDVSLATVNSELSVQMATDHDLAQPKAWGMGVAGWCAAENGDLEHGLALTTQAIAAMQAINSRHFLVYLLGLLADVHLKAEHHAEAMRAVEDGLAIAEATGERFYSALHRLHGESFAGAAAARPNEQGAGIVPRRHQGCQAARSQGSGAQGK